MPFCWSIKTLNFCFFVFFNKFVFVCGVLMTYSHFPTNKIISVILISKRNSTTKSNTIKKTTEQTKQNNTTAVWEPRRAERPRKPSWNPDRKACSRCNKITFEPEDRNQISCTCGTHSIIYLRVLGGGSRLLVLRQTFVNYFSLVKTNKKI